MLKANDDFLADDNYRNTHLPRFPKHFQGQFQVTVDVVFGEADTLSRKILYRPMAVRSGGRRVNDDIPVSGFTISSHLPVPVKRFPLRFLVECRDLSLALWRGYVNGESRDGKVVSPWGLSSEQTAVP